MATMAITPGREVFSRRARKSGKVREVYVDGEVVATIFRAEGCRKVEIRCKRRDKAPSGTFTVDFSSFEDCYKALAMMFLGNAD